MSFEVDIEKFFLIIFGQTKAKHDRLFKIGIFIDLNLDFFLVQEFLNMAFVNYFLYNVILHSHYK